MGTALATYREKYVTFLGGYANYALPLMRTGLGAVILLAGAHKLVSPDVWTRYAAPWVTDLWPETLVAFEVAMMVNGVFEVLFGLVLIAGLYTAMTAGIVALSLTAVVFDLLTGVATTGKFVDILIRDIGLLALATGVTVLAAKREQSADHEDGRPPEPGDRPG